MKHAILLISPLMFIDICMHGVDKCMIVKNALPGDSKYIRTFIHTKTGWEKIAIVIESEFFQDIKETEEIPILPTPIFEKE